MRTGVVFGVLHLFAAAVQAGQIPVETMLPEIAVDQEGDKNVFATPFDYRDGTLVTVHVEPPGAGGTEHANLRTVVRLGSRDSTGRWSWESKVIEDRTLRDPWHTQASVAFDRHGFIHVAYNMHNMPWQYSVSTAPMSIAGFAFRGQPVSEDELHQVRFRNKTPFPDSGTAAIPGNQVTYPMFFSDANKELYVTYRFALRPARAWKERGFAGGIARYDADSKLWTSVGGEHRRTRDDVADRSNPSAAAAYPFAFEDGYSVYLITLSFDSGNGVHAFWNWREGGAGTDTTRPSHAYSPDGRRFVKRSGEVLRLPVRRVDSEPIEPALARDPSYAPKSAAVLPEGTPLVVIQSISGGRYLYALPKSTGRWTEGEPMPDGASEILVDAKGDQWAFASGLKVFTRGALGEPWRRVGEIGNDLCSPRVRYFGPERRFIVHAKRCDGGGATILSFRR